MTGFADWAEAATAEIRTLGGARDNELAHVRGDTILCEALTRIGEGPPIVGDKSRQACLDLVDAWKEAAKWWYA